MSRTTQILVVVGLVAGSLAAYWYLALAPKRDEVAKLESQVAAKQAEVRQLESTAGNYETARKAYRENYETVVRLGKAVPADDDVRSLVVQLDASAKRSKVDFSALKVGGNSGAATSPAAGTGAAPAAGAATPPPGASAVGAAGFLAMPFSFTFQGRFFRLGDFFGQLEHYVKLNDDAVDVRGRLLRVETFKLTPSADGATLKADIGATSYMLPESEGLTAGATPSGPSATATPAGGSTPTTTATAGVIR